jgi:hypothetical protein
MTPKLVHPTMHQPSYRLFLYYTKFCIKSFKIIIIHAIFKTRCEIKYTNKLINTSNCYQNAT